MIFRPSLTKSSLLLNKTKCCKIPCTTASQCSLFNIFANNIFKLYSFSNFNYSIKCIFNEVEFTSVARGSDSILMSQSEVLVNVSQPIRSWLTSAGCW